MHRKTIVSMIALLLLLCAGCRQTADPSVTPEPTETPAPMPAPPYRSASLTEEPTDAFTVAVSLYGAGTNDFDGERIRTVTFSGLKPRTVDRSANPMRFSEDLSVWMTYDRDGDWDNCTLGRSINDAEDWRFLNELLFSREYTADPDARAFIQTPRFIVRKGDLCRSSTSMWDEVGKTYYIDDEVCTYWIDPDGTVIRTDADGTVSRAVEPLEAEQTAYLYLLYEAHYMTPALQYPCSAVPEEMSRYHLLIERDGTRTELPAENMEVFLKLVTVETDQSAATYAPCFACTAEMFADADYPEKEVLRFRFVADGYDPDASPLLWFSLREDGHIVRDIPLGAGYIHTVARWVCFGRNRIVSNAVFSVNEILAAIPSA